MRGEEFDLTGRWGGLHAERWGSPSAPLVIGLPGLTGNVEHFAFLGERLGGDALQLVALDPRGRGRSDATPPGTYGWERHARDVLGVADRLGFDRFAVVGQSMGGSVAMKLAELGPARLDAVVLVDVAGRVDRGVAGAIEAMIGRLGRPYPSADHYVDHVRSLGFVDPWNEYWERAYRYDLPEVTDVGGEPGARSRTSLHAVREDRAYTATQGPYARWVHLTMPTLLLRATRELRAGTGLCVPGDDRDRLRRAVPHAVITEVDANHLTIITHADAAAAIHDFLVGRHLLTRRPDVRPSR